MGFFFQYAGIVLILFIAKLFAIFLWFDMNAKVSI